MTIADIIRGSSLFMYRALVNELGGDADALLRRVGIDPRHAGSRDDYIEYRQLVDAVERAAQETRTPRFGRLLASRQGIEVLGPVGVAARTAATFADAMRVFETYLAAYSPAVEVQVRDAHHRGHSQFEFRIVAADVRAACPQTVELSVGVALQVFRFLLGAEWNPLAVQLPHQPLTSDADTAADFGCRVRFGEPLAGFTFPTVDLGRPLSAEPITHEAMVHYLESILPEPDLSTTETVRRLIRELLPTGTVSAARIAAECHLHPKTLQRRLRSEHTTFAEELDRVRRETARQLLRDTDISQAQLAHALGYAEQSVLSRASRRWFGSSPTALRASLRRDPQRGVGTRDLAPSSM